VTKLDDVILATGYQFKFPMLSEDVMPPVVDNEVQLYKYVFPPGLKHPTLAVIGLVQPLGAVFPIAEMQVSASPEEEARPFLLECEAAGNPEPTYQWTKNGIEFNHVAHDTRISQMPNRGTLVFTKPEDMDEGLYQCWATNIHGTAVSSASIVRKSGDAARGIVENAIADYHDIIHARPLGKNGTYLTTFEGQGIPRSLRFCGRYHNAVPHKPTAAYAYSAMEWGTRPRSARANNAAQLGKRAADGRGNRGGGPVATAAKKGGASNRTPDNPDVFPSLTLQQQQQAEQRKPKPTYSQALDSKETYAADIKLTSYIKYDQPSVTLTVKGKTRVQPQGFAKTYFNSKWTRENGAPTRKRKTRAEIAHGWVEKPVREYGKKRKHALLVGGDFNAKHGEWGYAKSSARGAELLRRATDIGLVLINKPGTKARTAPSTNQQDTTPDPTWADPHTARKTE
ncbi:hypothetical protein HPB47_014415, partial [Ixodes persulcatus]